MYQCRRVKRLLKETTAVEASPLVNSSTRMENHTCTTLMVMMTGMYYGIIDINTFVKVIPSNITRLCIRSWEKSFRCYTGDMLLSVVNSLLVGMFHKCHACDQQWHCWNAKFDNVKCNSKHSIKFVWYINTTMHVVFNKHYINNLSYFYVSSATNLRIACYHCQCTVI